MIGFLGDHMHNNQQSKSEIEAEIIECISNAFDKAVDVFGAVNLAKALIGGGDQLPRP